VLSATDGEAATGPLGAGAAPVLLLDLTLPLLDHAALIAALAPALPADPGSLADLERRHIAGVLEHTGGNRRDAAHILGIARSTLLAKLRRYGLDARS
jgi:transcriptional regulator of acetoin/glycerol metabolism